ncbi:MAG: cupin [Devosia sp.]|nr:cupin [Devosia sp.]
MSKPIVNIAELALKSSSKGSRFAAAAGRIGGVIGLQQLGAQYFVVPAGKSAFPRHAHRSNEEMFVIIDGAGEYRLGDETWAVRAGDVIAAPAGGLETAHQLRNTSDGELRYLAISTRNDPDIVLYADSNKFAVASGVPEGGGLKSAQFFYVGRADSAVDYWDGEAIGDDE